MTELLIKRDKLRQVMRELEDSKQPDFVLLPRYKLALALTADLLSAAISHLEVRAKFDRESA